MATPAFLDACAQYDVDLLSRYRLFEKYYEGDQNTQMLDRTRRYLQRSGLRFSENFAEVVVDSYAERLAVTGVTLEDKTEARIDLSEQSQIVDGWLQLNRIDMIQQVLHTKTIVCGDGYLMVDWNDQLKIPRLTFNAPELHKPVYSTDQPGLMLYDVKKWPSNATGPQNKSGKAIIRMNVYFPDRIEKYFSDASDEKGDWTPWRDDPAEPWPIPWLDETGRPLGVPVFHFRHKQMSGAFGRSELQSMLSQQDLLNKQVIDLAEISDYMAAPQRWAKGISQDNANLEPGPGKIITTSAENAQFGEWAPADLSKVNDAIEATLARIARRSRTPMHLLTGGSPPSGEALKTAESGLVAKVKAAQVVFGQSWEDACLLMLRLGQKNQLLKVPNLAQTVVQMAWQNPETRDEFNDARKVVALHQEGLLSTRTAQTDLGYDPDVEADNRAKEAATLNEAMGRLLDAGVTFSGLGAEKTLVETAPAAGPPSGEDVSNG